MNYPKALRLAIIGLLAITTSVCARAEAEVPKSKSLEWSVRTYEFHPSTFTQPPDYLLKAQPKPSKEPTVRPRDPSGVAPDHFKLTPPIPRLTAAKADQINFIKKSTEIIRQSFRPLSIDIPEGTLFAYDQATSTLAVRTSPECHHRLTCLEFLATRPKQGAARFRLDVLATDTTTMRAAIGAAANQKNHNSILADFEKRIDQGLAQRITALKVDSRDGQRVHVSTGAEAKEITSVYLDEKFRPTYEEELIMSGMDFEVDTVLSEDLAMLDVTYAFSYDYAPVKKDSVIFPTGGPQPLSLPLYHHRKVSVSTSISIAQGSSRLIAVWSPDPSSVEPITLQAAFLRADTSSLEPPANQQMPQMLTQWGEQISPTPKPKSSKESQPITEGMVMRRFRLPPSCFPGDPVTSTPLTKAESLRTILISLGAKFPAGATVDYFPGINALLVLNTPKNLHEIEVLLDDLTHYHYMVTTTLQIIQADGQFLRKLERETASSSDHTSAWKAVEAAAAQDKVQFLNTAQLDGKDGHRARFEAGEWRMNVSLQSPQAPAPDAAKEEDKRSTPAEAAALKNLEGVYWTELYGTSLEVDPVVGKDEATVDLTLALSYDYAPPTESVPPPLDPKKAIRLAPSEPTLHRFTMNTSLSLLSGQPRLLSIWKPEGKPAGTPAGKATDILQAAFIRVDVLRDE